MKNQNDKPEQTREPKVWRRLYGDKERKSVCGCPHGCLDRDTHQSLALGGHTDLRDWRI